MGRFKESLWGMLLVMVAFCGLSGALLAWVHVLTTEPIGQAAVKQRIDAVADILPAFDNNPVDEGVSVDLDGEPRTLHVYPALRDGEFVGAAVESYSSEGFSGDIVVMYGFDVSGNITGYRVVSHAETPGLGAKMEQWFRMPEGRRSVIGRNPVADNLTVAKDGSDVDGITAATITSRAFLDALHRAHECFKAYCETYNNQGV